MFDQQSINKLILLYIFDKMDVPLQENIIVEMATENNWINYMECKESLADLIKTSFVANISPRSSTPRYTITSDGRECLNHFYTNINSSVRDDITDIIKKNRMKYRKKQDYFSDYYKNADGTYTVVLKIESNTMPLMELKLNIQNRNTAKWIFKNWADKAPQVYEFIQENLVD
ncbi:MAG: DUF4364 family protein [Christensenellales bacterium]